ncbi:MAG: LLM class flavin-dependent oxidoreductase [Acidimicrobiia bacterium]|nr:LLM class flavin-dependent oxidoreductase [Acidimicrobiia bacterium]
MVANRIVQLDHMTRGRVMFGVGPGALPSDAFMMGIDPATQRRRMEESLEAITALLRAEEPVSRETDWFTLRDGRLHLLPYSWPSLEIAVAAQVSPAGPRTAGRFGAGLLSLGATSMGGFDVLGQQREVWFEAAEASGHSVDRADWRLVGPMHVAETREQAFKDVQYGLPAWVDYFRNVVVLPIGPVTESEDPEVWAQVLVESGFAVIGDPDDAVAQIERLEKQTGGFGTFLTMHNEWADRDAMRRSYELLAKEVFPRFQGSTRGTQGSMAWCRADRPTLLGSARDAVVAEIKAHRNR